MKKTKFLIMLMGIISIISSQGWGQNPSNYQRTIRVMDSLVQVFEGDMTTLLETYVGSIKGSSLYITNTPSEIYENRLSSKNAQIFWIDLNSIPGIIDVAVLHGKISLASNNLIKVFGSGPISFQFKTTFHGEEVFYCRSDVNYFGVTQWLDLDIPYKIYMMERGSSSNGVLFEGDLYLSEDETIGVQNWPNDSIGWFSYKIAGYSLLFQNKKTMILEELMNAVFPIPKHGNNFTLAIKFNDGEINGKPNSLQMCTLVDLRLNVSVEKIEIQEPKVQIADNLLRISGSSGLLQIYDISGKLIFSEQIIKKYEKVLHFSPGLYIVRIEGWSKKVLLR